MIVFRLIVQTYLNAILSQYDLWKHGRHPPTMVKVISLNKHTKRTLCRSRKAPMNLGIGVHNYKSVETGVQYHTILCIIIYFQNMNVVFVVDSIPLTDVRWRVHPLFRLFG